MSRAKCELWLCTWWLLCFPALTCYFVRCLKCKNILAEVCLLVSVCLLTKHNSDLFYFLFPASTERVTSLAVNLWGLWLRGVYNCLCFSCLHFSKSWCFSSLTKTWLIKGKITLSLVTAFLVTVMPWRIPGVANPDKDRVWLLWHNNLLMGFHFFYL